MLRILIKENLVLKLIKSYLDSYKEKIKDKKCPIVQTINQLQQIDVKDVHPYNARCSVKPINAVCRNIIEYNELLKYLLFRLGNELDIETSMLPARLLMENTLYGYFCHKGNYIETEIHLTEWINLSIEFLTMFRWLELHAAKTLTVQRNLRLTADIVGNIMQVTKELAA